MINLGVLQAVLRIKDEMGPQLSKAKAQIARAAAAITTAIAATAAATAVALIRATKEALRFADALDNQSKATQVGVEALQLYNAAAERAGQGSASITTAIQRMQRAIGEGTAETDKAIANLGLSIAQLKALSPEKQFELIMQRLGQIPDPAEKAANAMILLGRSGGNLLALSGDALPKLRDQMLNLGLVIDRETISAVDKLEEDIDLLGRTAKASWLQLGAGIATSEALSGVVGLLTEALGGLNRAIRDNGDVIRWWANLTIGSFANVVLTSGNLMSAFVANVEKASAVLRAASTSPKEALLSGKNPFAGLGKEFAKIDRIAVNSREVMKGWVDDLIVGVSDAAEAFGGEGGGGGLGGGILDIADAAEDAIPPLTDVRAALKLWADSIKPEFFKDLSDATRGWAESLEEAQKTFAAMKGGAFGESVIVPLRLETDNATSATDAFRQAVEDLDHTFAAFGIDASSSLGQVIASFSTLAAQIPQLKADLKAGGFGLGGALGKDAEGKRDFAGAASGVAGGIGAIASATSSGSTGARAGKGALAGASAGAQVGGPIGAAVGAAAGAITGFIRGKKMQSLLNNFENEVGVRMSESLAKGIKDSGKSVQLSVGAIFSEALATGTATADDLARETGDIFSFLERGDITEFEAITALENAVPLLLANFQDLGATGEAEVGRILSAAKEMGVEFDGLKELIQTTFATDTIETMAEKFGITNQEIRAMGEALGINIQTDLERIAASVGLTASEFGTLGAALESSFGIPAAQLAEFLESTGVSAADLADKLGVSVGPGADLAAQTDLAGQRLSFSADEAGRMASEIERAARAMGGVGGFSVGGDGFSLPPGLAHGGLVRANPPIGTAVRLGEREDEFAIPRSKLGGVGGGPTVNVVINNKVEVHTLATDVDALVVKLDPIMNNIVDEGRLTTAIEKRFEGIFQRR